MNGFQKRLAACIYRKMFAAAERNAARPVLGPGRKWKGLEGTRSSIAEVFLEADVLEGFDQMLEALHSARR